tara:strand:- start:1638 stop:2387 length:750 start_codon:yes stop_codon:yes gene_type:complete
MIKRLEGKRALVTAAGQGIGKATALAMVSQGAHVFATDINKDTLNELADEASGHGLLEVFELNVLDNNSINNGITKSKPDILFNCAGFVHNGTILEATIEEWSKAWELNVTSMFETIRAALPGMLSRGTGSIINMSSVVSSIKGTPNRLVYGTTKAAVIGLTKAVATDYITKGIRCNCICPGTVDTPSLHERLEATGDYKKAMREFIARQPMGRIGSANEIAALAVYLGSDESKFTTGHAHIIDGGWAT